MEHTLETFLTSVVESSEDAIFGKALDGTIRSWNRGAERLYGYSAHDAIGRNVRMLAPTEKQEEVSCILRRVALGERISQFETFRVAKDGRRVDVSLTACPILDATGAVVGIATVARDVTEQRRTASELEHLVNLSPDMICTANLQGYFTRVNPAFTRVLGFSRDELVSQPCLTFVHEEDRDKTVECLRQLADGQPVHGFQNRYRTKQGAYRVIEWNATVDAAHSTIYAVARDITERDHLEQQLRQVQKMEAVGQLAGGIAHDFNNLLTAMLGYAQLALDELPPGDVRDHVVEIEKAARSAWGLTGQLLAFSRRQLLQPSYVNLNATVQRMESLLRRLLGEHIVLNTRLQPELQTVHVDASQMEQIIMNLAINARDAMPDGGQLLIETDNAALDEAPVIHHESASVGAHVVLSVTDNGSGMTQEVQRRLFEPFFTTKRLGRGTGLGLATVYGIVKQSGGCVTVQSEVGRGTTFRIYLPAAARVNRSEQAAGDASSASTGSDRVLLADDQ
jgi:PAS domain S-box-containing protein